MKTITATIVLALSIGVLAQTPKQMSFSGSINDFTPASVSPAGPWVVNGNWSLTVRGDSGKASFSAALTMLRSDYWVWSAAADPDDPSARTPHTHHIRMVDGVVTPIMNGFRVTGIATVTGSGNPAPFGLSSPLQIDITGGSSVVFSNIRVTFGSPASGHFGSQPLDGVVSSPK
jgi:hypothetical protein